MSGTTDLFYDHIHTTPKSSLKEERKTFFLLNLQFEFLQTITFIFSNTKTLPYNFHHKETARKTFGNFKMLYPVCDFCHFTLLEICTVYCNVDNCIFWNL